MRPARRWFLGAAAAAGFIGGIAACQDGLHRTRVATCRRALPAVVAGPGVRLLRAGSGAAPDSVRVDYSEGARRGQITCRFDRGAGLTAVTAEGASLSGPALYMLKRFYLDTPDAERDDPGPR